MHVQVVCGSGTTVWSVGASMQVYNQVQVCSYNVSYMSDMKLGGLVCLVKWKACLTALGLCSD